MRLYEHEAKRVLSGAGLAVPRMCGLVASPEDLSRLTFSFPVMVKAQVLVGGRGKSGGVRRAASERECAAAVRDILGKTIAGYQARAVLIEEAVASEGSCYLGVTMNPATGNNMLIASASGGVDIEEAAASRPDAILRVELPDHPDALPVKIARNAGRFLAEHLGGGPPLAQSLAGAAQKLYDAYQKCDCTLVEVNPLLITPEGLMAADAKIVLDDNALYRQGQLLSELGIQAKRHEVAEPTSRERRAAAAGFPYVDLLPEGIEREADKVYVGLVPGGAGYGIFLIDEVSNIGGEISGGRIVPVNFMDSGGAPAREAVEEMFALLMDHPLVDVVITSRFGGISSCDVFIRGLVNCLRSRAAQGQRVVPVYGRMAGTDLPAARHFLDTARGETPDALAPLSMTVGNRQIMADVVRAALEDVLVRKGTVV